MTPTWPFICWWKHSFAFLKQRVAFHRFCIYKWTTAGARTRTNTWWPFYLCWSSWKCLWRSSSTSILLDTPMKTSIKCSRFWMSIWSVSTFQPLSVCLSLFKMALWTIRMDYPMVLKMLMPSVCGRNGFLISTQGCTIIFTLIASRWFLVLLRQRWKSEAAMVRIKVTRSSSGWAAVEHALMTLLFACSVAAQPELLQVTFMWTIDGSEFLVLYSSLLLLCWYQFTMNWCPKLVYPFISLFWVNAMACRLQLHCLVANSFSPARTVMSSCSTSGLLSPKNGSHYQMKSRLFLFRAGLPHGVFFQCLHWSMLNRYHHAVQIPRR